MVRYKRPMGGTPRNERENRLSIDTIDRISTITASIANAATSMRRERL
jgi:hypothetical protein